MLQEKWLGTELHIWFVIQTVWFWKERVLVYQLIDIIIRLLILPLFLLCTSFTPNAEPIHFTLQNLAIPEEYAEWKFKGFFRRILIFC